MSKVNNLAINYDTYYQGGDESIYNKRFGKSRYTPRERLVISKAIKRVLSRIDHKNNDVIRILDYGCGDGRLFEVINKLANKFSDRKRQFEIIGYDISIVGLTEFKNKLLSYGFKALELDESQQCSSPKSHGYCFGRMIKDNIMVSLIHGYTEDSSRHTLSLLGHNIHLNFCLFGVLAHIPGRNLRQQILSMFHEQLHPLGEIVLSVPCKRNRPAEQIIFNYLRKLYNQQAISQDLLGLAKEEGDIYYSIANDSDVHNYYHIFSLKEIKEVFNEIGLIIDDVSIYSIENPAWITDKKFKALTDYFLSSFFSMKIFNKTLLERIGKYIVINATKDINKLIQN